MLVALAFLVMYGAYTMLSWKNLHQKSLALETHTTQQVCGTFPMLDNSRSLAPLNSDKVHLFPGQLKRKLDELEALHKRMLDAEKERYGVG